MIEDNSVILPLKNFTPTADIGRDDGILVIKKLKLKLKLKKITGKICDSKSDIYFLNLKNDVCSR